MDKGIEVFFIVSHPESFNISYESSKKNKNTSDLKSRLSIKRFNKEDIAFIIEVYSFSFYESKNKGMIEEEIILNGYGSAKFIGKIKFNCKKNNFIYDFSFDIYHKDEEDIPPPKSFDLTKSQQLNIYIEMIKYSQIQNNELLFDSLIIDSFKFLKKENEYYFIDFYLSLLSICYTKKYIINLLDYFSLKRIKLSEIIDKQNFSSVLNKIKISQDFIKKHLNNESEMEKYLEIFYTLLLYYRLNYEYENTNELFDCNDAKFYRKILFSKKEYFDKICLNNSFFDNNLSDIEMNYNNLLLILNYLKRFDKILTFLNKNSAIILGIFNKSKENDKNEDEKEEEEEDENEGKEKDNSDEIEEEKTNFIDLIKIVKIKEDDNIDLISKEIDKILDNNLLKYVNIGQEFWENYAEYFNNKNLNILIHLEKIINKLMKKQKEGQKISSCNFIYKFIHETGLNMAINHKFKNNKELLEFIKEKDRFYYSDKYKEKDLRIFKGLKLSELLQDSSINFWKSIHFDQIFDENQYKEFQEIIISLVSNIEQFSLLFQLFDYSNNKIFNGDTVFLFKNKYLSLIKNFNQEEFKEFNDKFIDDSALLIYLLDKKVNSAQNFIRDDLSKKLPISLINEIFLKILSRYDDLSDDISQEIIDFFTKKRENLKSENLIYIVKQLKNIKYIKQILSKISHMVIKRNMIFALKDSNEVKLFIEFQKMEIFKNEAYEYCYYVQEMFSFCDNILNDIKKLNVTYNEIQKISVNYKDLKQRLKILNIKEKLKEEEINKISDKIMEYVGKIKNETKLIDSYLYIDKTFFNISKHKEILELENLLNEIKDGKLIEINNYQEKINEYKSMYSKQYIEQKMLLSTSLFFTSIFEHLKKKAQNQDTVQNIFEEAFKFFKTTKFLFEKIPNEKIDEEIFEICLKAIRNNPNKLMGELYFIQDFFNLQKEKVFEKVGNSLILFSKKNEIVNIIKGIELFIKKEKAQLTDYFENLKNIKRNLSSKTINVNKIYEYLKELSKENLNIINLKNNINCDYLYIFIDFYKKQEALDFLLKLNEEDCRNFQEIIGIADNSFLMYSDIQDLENCVKFLKDIKSKNNNSLTDKILINNFINKANKNKKITLYFNSFFNNYIQIKELEILKFNKIETNKTKSFKISKDSEFYLSINEYEHPPDFTNEKLKKAPDCKFVVCDKDSVLPDNYHSTSIFPEYYKVKGKWLLAKESRMGCHAILKENEIIIIEKSKIKKGDLIAVGRTKSGEDGILVYPLGFHEDNNYAFFYGEYKSNEKEPNRFKNISFFELLELREITILNQNSNTEIETKQNEEETLEYQKKFSQNMKDIINLFNLLEQIAKKGYHEKLSIEIKIKNNSSSYRIKGKEEEYKSSSLRDLLNKILKNIKDTLINAYKSNKTHLIRLIYGRQFAFIYNCLINKNYSEADPLLNYLTNNLYKNKIKEFNYKENTYNGVDKNDFQNVIINCNNFFKEVLKMNNISVKDIYKQNIIDQKYKYRGLYNYLSIENEIEEDILSWYFLLTNNYPIAQTLLMCNKETSSDEIISFIHRAILCQDNVLFMVGKIEELPSDKGELLFELISELYTNKEKKMISCLAFIYSNNDAEIVRLIQRVHYCEILRHENKKKNLDEGIFENEEIEIYYSDKAGVGKSTKIKNEAIENEKNYVYFPLGGEFTKLDIISRLKNNNILKENKNIVLHIDLFDTKKTEEMKEFLFSLLITKLYGLNENIFYLNKETQIKIELPYGFIDFFSKIPFLKMFKNKINILIENLPPLIVSKSIDSDIQIICNYLRIIKNKKIIENDIYIPNISSSYYNELPEKITAEIISDDECKELIYDYLKIDFPNYYQINNFIKILSSQFKKLSLINSLSSNVLKKLGNKIGKPELKYNRYIICENIIKNTRFIISSTYQKLLNSQNTAYNINLNFGGKYDEKMQNELAIKSLSSPSDIISYDNIKIPLIFFYEGINPYFTIVSPYLPENQEYQNLLDLENIHSYLSGQKIKKSLKRYENFNPESFYKELKQILNLPNPINKDEDNPNNLNNIKDIIGYYVITADNFIKMLLILLRIRENVPVIMMGETGCGKTSLIRKLYQLMNDGEDNMKILNIHSGISNEDIKNFLFQKKEINNNMSIVEEANILEKIENKVQKSYLKKGIIYNKKKLWVFLDEINTCNCLGLISELICKHSCNGIPLPNNIVFIGACNPYRSSKIINYDGLKFKNSKTQNSNLVYTVNPLPHCLLNYVLNFGSLSNEDENKYIENIIKEPIEKFYLDELENNENIDNSSFSFFSFFKKISYSFISWSFGRKNVIKREHEISEISESKKKEYSNLFKAAYESITNSQKYIRNKNDVSSVSLREIRRFSIFYLFFVDYLRNKKENENNKQFSYLLKKLFYKNLDNFKIYQYSIILSVFICYYLRLSKKEDREEYTKIMDKIFLKYFEINFLDIPRREEKYIIDNIEIPQGIAKNTALLNNIFVLFVCVTAKIPLFIVGKPGCSKSLSVQLLFKSMKGEFSNNILFKSLPKLIINSYQGSLTSTSKGILKIFEKARNFLKHLSDNELNKYISMVYLDEMGLAENSPNNPLKVIHSELDYDLNDGRNKIACVGISNWVLDASKMNRGIFLSIPEADNEDLEKTAITIAKSYNKILANTNKDLFIDLSNTYYEYINDLKKYIEKKDFHGSRDFYHLIKIASKTLFNKFPEGNIDKNIKQNIAINSIERNLAGLKFEKTTSLEKVKAIFQKKYNNCEITKKYNILERIIESMIDINNRYLLLITNSSTSEYLIYSMLNGKNKNNDLIQNDLSLTFHKKNQNKEIVFYIGSRFIQDQYSEEYTLKMINKIQIQMEKNCILILKDLETIYPSLYDLFNQNFTVVAEKNYARLSVGYNNNTFSFVNKEFKCILLVDEKDIEDEDPPFLNRFEKHSIDLEYLLDNKCLELSNTIINILKNWKEIKLSNMQKLNYDIEKLFINLKKEEIQGIIYYLSSKMHNEEIENYILEKISMIIPQDIILLMNYSENVNKYNDEHNKIMEYYKKEEHGNLSNFLKNMEKNKNIIYTFSNIFDSLLPNLEKNNDIYLETLKFGKLQKSNIKMILISSINCENELENMLDNFYENKNEKIFILKMNIDEIEIIDYLRNFIEEKEKNYKENQNKKAFIFIIYLKRIFDNMNENTRKNELPKTITLLNENYCQIFIDNLNGNNMNIAQLINIDNRKDLIKKFLHDINSLIFKNIYSIFSYFTYTFISQINDIDISENNYSKYIVEFLNERDESKFLREKILDEIENLNIIKDDNIIEKVFISKKLKISDIDYISLINDYVKNAILQYLTQFIYKSEIKHIMSPLLSHINDDIKKNNKLFFDNRYISFTIDNAFKEINNEKDAKFINQIGYNHITLLLGINIPGIKSIIDNLILFINNKQLGELNLSEDYFNNENDIRTTENDNNSEYMKEINFIKKRIKDNELTLFEYLKSISLFKQMESDLENNNNNYNIEAIYYLNLFYDDYLHIFLSNNFELSNIEIYSSNLISNFKNLIKYLVKIRFNDYDEIIKADELMKKISRNILWIEANSKYIKLTLMIYQKLSFIQLINSKMKDIIKNNEIKYEFNTKRSPIETKLVNECFFLINESMLKIILNENNLYNKVMQINNNLYDFVNIIKEIYHYASQINYELNLFSKELSNLKSFIDIVDLFNELKIGNEENINKLIELLVKKNNNNNDIDNDNNEHYTDIIFKNIYNLYDFLKAKVGLHKNFSKLVNKIFFGEIKKIEDIKYRKSIIEIILNKKEMIKDSTEILIVVFQEIINISIDSIKEGDTIFEKYNQYFEVIENKIETTPNNNDNEIKMILEQVLLNLFESCFNIFFETIEKLDKEDLEANYPNYFNSLKENKPNDTLIMLDFSLETFKNKILKLEEIFDNNIKKKEKDRTKYINIDKLYSIAYIKIYLNKAINFILKKRQEFLYFESNVMRVIQGESSNDFRKIIKFYILKLLYDSLNNYQELQQFHYISYGFKFFEEFKEQFNSNNNETLNYFILPKNEKFYKYEECSKEFDKVIENNFIHSTEYFEKFINEENIDIFYSFSVNRILSNLELNESLYQKFSSYCKNILNNIRNSSENFKKLLFLLIDEQEFKSKIRPKILMNKGNLIDSKAYEILLYSMRFCLQTNYNKSNKNLYSSLISEKCINIINKLCLPGNDESCDKIINNYYLLENHLNTKPSDYGAYVCSCGEYYGIPPCGFPIESYNCLNCKKLIGGQEIKKEEIGFHKMIIRKGHYRVFKNIEDKNKEFNRFKDTDKLIPNILLSDYKTKVIDPLIKTKCYGIAKMDRFIFIQKDKKIRNLSQVGYRLLNYILYSHLFFSYCLGYLNDEFQNKYLSDDMNFIEIIKINWELLEEALFNRGITLIQIFLNFIFDKISKLLKKCPEIYTIEERNKFEDSIEKILEEAYKEYENYSNIYLNLNLKLHDLDKENLKSIILELYNPEDYPEEKYPFLKFFMITKYQSEEGFIKELKKISNYNKLYPLITSYINPENDKIKYLKELPKYNKFINLMINKYSYRISRKEAHEKKIYEEDIFIKNENNFKETLDEFIEIWNKISPYCTKYKCHQMDEEILNNKMVLENFLIDDGEIGKGMYLASGYQNFIKWQNEFLEPISKTLDGNKGGILYYLNESLKNRIDVQKANKNEIISKDFPDNSIYFNFLHLISLHSHRNIFYKSKNDQIIKKNYFSYNNFIYDFDEIEGKLGNILLTGKKLFNNENIKFITYCYEGFRGEKSSTLINFIELYPQKKLNDSENSEIFDYINKTNAYNTYDFTKLMFSIQLLIYYLTQEKKSINLSVYEVIKSSPEYLYISEDCKEFFGKFYKIQIEKLFDVFSFVELLCYDLISKNLKDDYKIDLEKSTIEKINNYFKNGYEKKIGKINLASACRKLISRYLISSRSDNDINPENLLSLYLDKPDLWDLEIMKEPDIFELELNEIKEFKIKVNQAFKLCILLDSENVLLKNIKKKMEEKVKDKNKSKNLNEERGKKIGKKKKIKI